MAHPSLRLAMRIRDARVWASAPDISAPNGRSRAAADQNSSASGCKLIFRASLVGGDRKCHRRLAWTTGPGPCVSNNHRVLALEAGFGLQPDCIPTSHCSGYIARRTHDLRR